MYKISQGMVPVLVRDLFNKKESLYNLRDESKFVLPSYNTIVVFGNNNLSYYGSYLWNSLDAKCKNAAELNEEYLKNWSGPSCSCGYCLICLFR